MKKLTDRDYKILFELIKNSKISDRKLAKRIGVSQPTVTRRRAGLEKKGLIEYTGIPNFEKLGLDIMAFHLLHWKPERYQTMTKMEDFLKKVNAFVSEHPSIIFASSGQGLGMSRMTITLHKSYSDFVDFRRKIESSWGQYIAKYDNFIVSLRSDNVIRPFTFKYLADYLKKKR